jgi:hypothetical protein
MATFYKYQERDVDSQVNWADVGSGLSNLVTDQLATRKAKKEAYDDQVRAFNQYLDEHPVGDNQNMTEWTASYASQMQQQMLANQRAFKNGQISERDNVVFIQNVQNGTKTMFDLSTEYQAEFARKMERLNSTDPKNKSQELELWVAENNESWSNFKNTKPIIDPRTGLVLLSKKNEKGEYENVSAADLSTRIKQDVNYFDVDAATTQMQADFGENVISGFRSVAQRAKKGELLSVADKRTKDEFEKSLDVMVQSQSDTYNISSILTNSISSTNYEYTTNAEEASKDKNKILLIQRNGQFVPDFSTTNGKEQQKVAQDFMKQQFLGKIDYVQQSQTVTEIGDAVKFAPQQRIPKQETVYDWQREQDQFSAKNFAKNAYTLLFDPNSGNVGAAANFLVSQSGGKQLGLGKNEYGVFTRNENYATQDSEKILRSLVGTFGQTPAMQEMIVEEFNKLNPPAKISSTKGQSGRKNNKAKSGGNVRE